jgi:hypothetical protein
VRPVLLVIALAVAIGSVGCGGDDNGEATEPLTLEQRVLRESDAPGSKADPVETRKTARSLDEFTGLHGTYVRAAEIERSKLEDAGLVSAVHDTRFYPEKPGGVHTPDAPHVRVLVMQFESEDGAAEGLDLLDDNNRKPCPESCALRMEDFDVSGVADARGLRHYATAERIKAIGEEGDPFDAYIIIFTDGPFTYEVEAFGPPGASSKERTEEIAKTLHDRVEGAPLAEA